MKKRLLVFLVAAVLLSLLSLSAALADIGSANVATYWDSVSQANLFYEPHYGIVTCRNMTIRDRAATSGTSYGSIKNGQPVKILGISGDGNFYMIDLASCGFQNTGAATYGFGKASLIKIDPQFLACTRLTDIYATPWSTSLKIGEHVDRYWLVLDQNYGWYAVQAMESTAGTGFILSSDIGYYSNYQQKYIITWNNVPLLDEYSWAQTRTLDRFSVGNVYSVSGDYTLLVFNEGQATEYRGWVSNQFVAPIIN